MTPPPFARTFRPRAAIERALIEGIRAIVDLHDFNQENRVVTAVGEISLAAHIGIELLLDCRDLLMECAWRLSDLAPPEVKPHESDPEEGDS